MYSKSQTLITGVYRSGTEYITQLLGNHPEISASMYHVNALRYILGRFDPINISNNYENATNFLLNRLKEKYSISLNKDVILFELNKIHKVSYCNIYDIFMTKLFLNNKYPKNWAEKCQLLWREIPYFLEEMKNGFAVHIIRDPRAVLASFKKFTIAPSPLYLTAVYNSLDSLKNAYSTKDSRIALLKYEDVLLNPYNEILKVWNKIGLTKLNKNILNNINWYDDFGNEWLSNSSFQRVRADKFNNKIALNAWKDELTFDEIIFVESICGKFMEYFGYELSNKTLYNNKIIDIVRKNKQLNDIHCNFEKTGEGIQAFPINPLKSDEFNL